MGLKDRSPYLMFGGKIDPISEIRNAGLITTGDVYWVKSSGDSDYNTVRDSVGADKIFNDIQSAIDKCTGDQDEWIFVCPIMNGSAWEVGTAIDMDKARVHLISLGYGLTTHGYSNTIRGHAAGSMDDEIIHVTQEGCEIAGFRILGTAGTGSGGTMDNGLLYLSGSAHDLWVHDCEIENTGSGWDDDIPTGLVNAAASQHGARFDNCMIGGTVAEASGTQTPVVCSASGRRWVFHNCRFIMMAGNAGQKFAVAGTGKIDYTLFDNCQFINFDVSPLVTSAVTGDVTDDQGAVLFHYCTLVNGSALGTDDNAWVAPVASGTAALVYDPGVASGTVAKVAV